MYKGGVRRFRPKKIDLDNFDYIFIDFFDTIFSRQDTNVERAKYLSAEIFVTLLRTKGIFVPAVDLSLARSSNEKSLRDKAIFYKGFDPEVSILDLFCSTLSMFGIQNNLDLAMHWVEIESNVESKLLQPNKDVIEFLKDCRLKNKRVYVISDMYLQKEQFEYILQRHQMQHLVDGIFTSSDTLLGKYSGRLFNHAINELNIDNRARVMHLGDNPHSDMKMAATVGIQPYFRPPVEAKNSTKPLNKFSSINEIISAGLLSFAFNAIQRIIAAGEDHVLFVSREGIYLLDVFERVLDLLPNAISQQFPKHSVLYASRQSSVASYYNGRQDIHTLLEKVYYRHGKYNLRLFFSTWNIKLEDFSPKVILLIEPILDSDNHEDFRQAVQESIFGEELDILLKDRKEQFIRYISQETEGAENVAIVDVGWSGSIAKAISHSHWSDGKHLNVNEYYFGANSNGVLKNFEASIYGYKRNAYSFLSFKSPNAINDRILTSIQPVIENMLTTSKVGSCTAYEDTNGAISPVLAPIHATEDCELKAWQENVLKLLDSRYQEMLQLNMSLEEYELRARKMIINRLLYPSHNDIPNFMKMPIFDLGWGDNACYSIVNFKNLLNGNIPNSAYWVQGTLAHSRLSVFNFIYNNFMVLLSKHPRLKRLLIFKL